MIYVIIYLTGEKGSPGFPGPEGQPGLSGPKGDRGKKSPNSLSFQIINTVKPILRCHLSLKTTVSQVTS